MQMTNRRPLRITMRNERENKNIFKRAKQLKETKQPALKEVFIKRDMTYQERQNKGQTQKKGTGRGRRKMLGPESNEKGASWEGLTN